MPKPEPVETGSEETGSEDAKKPDGKNTPTGQHTCPHCQAEMKCIVQEQRPKWRELFYGPSHPAWYEWTSLGKCSPPDDRIAPDDPIEEGANDALPTESEPDIFDEIIASQRR